MNFSLRAWTKNDLHSLVKYADNPKIAAMMSNKYINPYTYEQGEKFIGFATKEKPYRILAIDVVGEAVGAIGVHPGTDIYCKNAELGYWLGEPFWGKGIMTKAVIQMVDYGFQNWDISRIYARPYGTNTGSQKVLEKAGFVLEARLEKTIFKNEVYLDELIYAVRKAS